MRCSSNGKTIDSKPINVGSIPTQRAIFLYTEVVRLVEDTVLKTAGAYKAFKSSNLLASAIFNASVAQLAEATDLGSV